MHMDHIATYRDRNHISYKKHGQAYPTPHFRDSTPSWSVRGATREALDALPQRPLLTELLSRVGRLSAEVGHALDASLQRWAEQSRRLQLPKGEALALHLAPLKETVKGLEELRDTVEKLREIWQVSSEVLDPRLPCSFHSIFDLVSPGFALFP